MMAKIETAHELSQLYKLNILNHIDDFCGKIGNRKIFINPKE
jgi:hypothetical protein